MSPMLTLEDVVSEFDALERMFLERRDRRAVFMTVYGMMSREMKRRIEAGAFQDNLWVRRYTVAFANLYREALDTFDRRGSVPRCWTIAFETAAAGRALVSQDLLLGINAHINHDLALALDRVSIEPDRSARYRDHTAVNEVLRALTDAVSDRLAAFYAPGLAGVDAMAGPLDEQVTNFSIVAAREHAWEAAVGVANARTAIERATTIRLLDVRTVVLAKLLLAPTLSPLALEACRRVEAGGWWKMLSEMRTAA